MTTHRLPIPDSDDGSWGAILNDFLLQAHNNDGSLSGVAIAQAGAEQTTNKGQPSGYAALDTNGGLDIVNRVMRVGPIDYPYTADITAGGPSSAYTIIDKSNTGSDSTILLRDQGSIRAEIGLAGDNNIHFKTVTGTPGSEVFSDRLFLLAAGTSWFPGSLGVGTIPTELLHISSLESASRSIVKVENTNASTGSVGTEVEFKGTGNDWSIGTDAGLNGGNNLFIQDNNAGYPPRVLVDGSGNVAIGKDNATYKLDVVGDIASNAAGNGFRIKEGMNAKMGIATLISGTVVVSTTAITTNSRIFLTIQSPAGTVGSLYVSTRAAGTSFTIASTSGTDASTVAWILIEPS